jgi:hypothetical protein
MTLTGEDKINAAVKTVLRYTSPEDGRVDLRSANELACAVQRVLELTAATLDDHDPDTSALSAADVLDALWGEET